jgi:cell division protease FtsH
MIVEDDKIVASELYNLLTNSSYEATILTNFENALETILKSNSDLILLDINIPYLNGELLLKNIRKKSNIPIIMVTSKTNEADEALSIMYGADDYIIKPYNPTILLLRISNIFKRCEQKLDIIKLVILTILLIALIVVSIVLIVKRQTNDDEQDDKVLAYTELVKEIQNKNVEKIEMTVGSTTLKVKLKDEEEEKKAIIPNTQVFMELIQSQTLEGNEIKLEQKTRSVISQIPSYFFSILPTAIMVALFIMIYKMQGLGDKGQVYEETERKTKITFDDIAGLDEEKAELKEIVEFLKEPKRFTEMGAKIPKGVLLYGKPGTGKTLIAKAIAGEADVPFISMSGSEFIEMFAGLGASRVRKLFEKARKISPCIVFIDEIDAIGSRRTSNSGAETENNQTLNQLLVEMDGFSSEETIIVLAATNRPEMLDKALLRPGRFDRQITIPAPDIAGREEILKIHSKDKKLANDVSLHSIAEDTAGFTGAELANILNEAAIIATKNQHNAITNDDLDEAVKKVTVGLEKTSRKISDKDKKLTAYHEAGHAIVSQFLPTQTAVKEISIVPRGVAGGYTMYKSDEDKSFISKTEMEEKLIALLGGRAAEKIVLDDISTGASNDIEVATEIAKNMVTVYGMSDVVGPICLKSSDGNYEYQLLGNNMEDIIGQEVKKLIDTAYKSAQQILLQNMDLLHAIAAELIAKEKINEEEFNKFFMQ